MAGNVNKVMIVGILGVDPEVRQLNAGQQMAHLRVATSERWRDRATGEQRERTEWHQVTVFDEQAISYAADYLRKGSRVFIEGKVETRRWITADGQERYSTEVVVNSMGGRIEVFTSAVVGNGHIDLAHASLEASMSGLGGASSAVLGSPFDPPF